MIIVLLIHYLIKQMNSFVHLCDNFHPFVLTGSVVRLKNKHLGFPEIKIQILPHFLFSIVPVILMLRLIVYNFRLSKFKQKEKIGQFLTKIKINQSLLPLSIIQYVRHEIYYKILSF